LLAHVDCLPETDVVGMMSNEQIQYARHPSTIRTNCESITQRNRSKRKPLRYRIRFSIPVHQHIHTQTVSLVTLTQYISSIYNTEEGGGGGMRKPFVVERGSSDFLFQSSFRTLTGRGSP